MSASAVLRRLETGERWWPAELGLRGFGVALLGSCAGLASWLYRGLHAAPASAPGVLHYLGAAAAVACWSLGGALLAEGPGLSRLVPRPPRSIYRQF